MIEQLQHCVVLSDRNLPKIWPVQSPSGIHQSLPAGPHSHNINILSLPVSAKMFRRVLAVWWQWVPALGKPI